MTVNLTKAGGANYRPETDYAYNSSGDVETVTDPTGGGGGKWEMGGKWGHATFVLTEGAKAVFRAVRQGE